MAIDRIGVQPIVVAHGAPGLQTYRVSELGGEGESEPSAEVTCTNDLSVDGNVNYLHWRSDATAFRVYRSTAGIFVGLADVTVQSFLDDGSIEVG